MIRYRYRQIQRKAEKKEERKKERDRVRKKHEKKMVSIRGCYTVIPNESTPQGRLWLSEMDQVVRLRHTPTIYIYKAKDNYDDAIERLRNSLSKVLVPYYPMAGRLCWTEGGRIELELNARGAILLEAETTKTMADYGDFSPSDSTKELVPTIDYNQPMENIPLFAVQITRFHGNEGLAIGVDFFHPLADGLGAIRFINSWAKIARARGGGGGGGGGILDDDDPNEMPFLDRTILKFSHPPLPLSPPRFDHIELKQPMPLILGRSDSSIERNKKTTAALLRLTAEQVEKLKKAANQIDNIQLAPKEGSRPYSRYEAIAAHVWRCASKARELEENQPTVVPFQVEIRDRMIPPLPRNYFGNALTQTAARGYVGEITSTPLSYVAHKIRKATELVTHEYIMSQIDVIRAQEHLDSARAMFLFVEQGTGGGGSSSSSSSSSSKKNAPFFGNPNLPLTSWMSLPVYEADFGWGKPVHFGLARVCPYDRGIILFSPDGDGSVILCMHFQIAHMQPFKNFFYGDINL